MSEKINRIRSVFLAGTLVFGLAACTNSNEGKSTGIQEAAKGEKTAVTALCYTTFPAFEALVEETFDDIDLEIEISSPSTYNSDTLRRLRNGHGKDLVFTSMPNGDISSYVLDLSAQAFTTNFASDVMTVIQHDGKNIWLPMPSVYKGLIVNKTLVEELGKELPDSQQDLKDVMEAARKADKGVDDDGFAFAMTALDGISVGEMIISTMVPDFLGTIDGERWTNDFIAKRASAEGTLEEPLSFLLSLSREGYMDPSRIHMGITQKNAIPAAERMADRKMTLCYGSSDLLQEIRKQDEDDEFVMMPFMSSRGNEMWVTTTPASYLGVNAAAGEDEEKLDAVLRVLELFSSPEGQSAILMDTGSDSSYLTAEVEGSGAADSGLESYVEAGYVYNMNRFNSDMMWLLGNNIVKVCMGDMELSEALSSIDNFNQNGISSYSEDHALIGSVEEDLLYEEYNSRKEETALGNLIADSVAEQAGVGIAFVNGGAIRASLYAGDIYTSDLAEVCPYANTIVVLDVTGETLYQMLENSIGHIFYDAIPGGRFLQVSGLHYTFSVDKKTEDASDPNHMIPAEARLLEVTLAGGSAIERDETYRIAVTNYMSGSSGYVDGGDDYTMLNVFDDAVPKAEGAVLVEETGKTYADALISYFKNHNDENINPSLEGRIIVQEGE